MLPQETELSSHSHGNAESNGAKATTTAAMKVWSEPQIPGEAPRYPRGDGNRTLRVALVVFASCNLVLALTKAHRHLSPPRLGKASPTGFRNGVPLQVDPVSFVLCRVVTVAMAYFSAAACSEDRQTLEEMFSKAKRTWKRPVTTLLCVELLATASSSLLWTLAALTRATKGAVVEALFISGSAVLAVWLWPVLFAHSEIACKLSLVVSIEEEEYEGMEALQRAAELVEGRKLQGFVLATLLAHAEQAPSAVLGLGNRGGGGGWQGEALADHVAGSFVVATLHLLVKFLSNLAYTRFYHECKKNHGKGRWRI